MIKKVFCRGMAAALLSLMLGAPLGAAELRAIQLNAGADSAEVTLDLDEAVVESIFTLEHPDRIVIDLRHTRHARSLDLPAPGGVVTAVRFGPQPGGTLRVVVQMKSPLALHSRWTGEDTRGRQLVLNLGEAATAPAPAQLRTVRAAHAPGEGSRDVIIAVDAGHGGQDPGAIGRGGTREKDVTLAIARALAERINAEAGMRAVLTRDRDEFLELRDRIGRAHTAHADMFVSVHADSIADRSISGASVYVLSAHGASSEAARVLAERENAADLMGGVLEDKGGAARRCCSIWRRPQIIGVSATAAERVVSALEGVGEVRKAQVQQAGFVVLKSPDIPSMLVETAYISNPEEERRLKNASQQARLADAIASGIRSYFVQNPPDGTRFKQQRRDTLAQCRGTPPPAPRHPARAASNARLWRPPAGFACNLGRLHAYPYPFRRTRRSDRRRRSDRAPGLGREGTRREQSRCRSHAHRDRRGARRHRADPGPRRWPRHRAAGACRSRSRATRRAKSPRSMTSRR